MESFARISGCYYPTAVLIVDDNKNFLKTLSVRLADTITILSFDEPLRALEHVNYHLSNPFTNRCLSCPEDDYAGHRVIEVDVQAIHREIYNDDRFNEITVVVADYSMPGLNGLEFFQQLKDKTLKKILLTGEGDNNLAVKAFNDGIIDKFILKSTPNMTDMLKQAIQELQYAFFYDLSTIIINSITKNSLSSSCLEDLTFVEYFNRLVSENGIVEYYLIEAVGSFLLLDNNANASWLITANEEMMHTYELLAEDDDAPQSVIDALKTRSMIPYFYSQEDFDVRPAMWGKYLLPAKQLAGKEIIYCAYDKKPNISRVFPKQILSYQKFLAL